MLSSLHQDIIIRADEIAQELRFMHVSNLDLISGIIWTLAHSQPSTKGTTLKIPKNTQSGHAYPQYDRLQKHPAG